ncbi:MAG: C25 family cysteine peptidase [Thermoanaerobaculaceae bacterium]
MIGCSSSRCRGASLDSNNDSRYGDGVQGGFGSGSTNLNNVGLYEFVTATSTLAPGASGSVSILGNGPGDGLINAYTNANATATAGQSRYQVARVPQYTTVTLNNVQAQPWSTQTSGTIGLGTGGIVAIDASGQVTLSATSIDVSGQGFRGGGQFQQTGASAPEDYRSTTTTLRYGLKGEGIAGTPKLVYVDAANPAVDTLPGSADTGYPDGSVGRGAPSNAGGGGTDTGPANDNNSGGGGGANGGAGGWGGLSWLDFRPQGGGGGVPLRATNARLFMGGGGGGGSNNNNPGNAGARGGGIVILTAGSITGTGSILANGASATDILNDGAGGGGAGGSVLIRVVSGGPGTMTASANGGNGGNAWPTSDGTTGFGGNRHGPGGGGGGGIVLYQASSAPTSNVTGGNNGTSTTSSDPYGARDGYAGVSASFAGTLPGIVSACLADPAVTISHSTDPWTQGSTGRHVYVDLRNADFGTSTSGTTTVQITLPTTQVQLTPTAVSGGADWSCSIAGQVVTCTSTSVKVPLATFSQIDITVSVGSYTSSAVVTVPAVITGWGTNRVTSNDTASEDIIILSPTLADVAEGYAVPMAEGVCVTWSTSYEVSNLGFAVWRETGTERVRVNGELVAGSALQVGADMPLAQGRPYRVLDTTGRDLDAKYWVEDIDLSGRSTWHGPFLIDKDVPVGAGCPTAPTLRELGRLPEGPIVPAGMLASRAVAAPTLRPDVARQPSSVLGVQVGVKIGVQDTGWYRVPASQLVAAGLDPAVDTANLQLYSEGVEYPFLVEQPTDVTARRVDGIQFYGFGIDSPYTRTRVFWLVRGTRPGLRLTPAPRDEGSRPAAAFAAVAERRDRTTFFASLTTNGEAENFFGPLVATVPVVLPLELEHVEPRSDITPALVVRLQGVTDALHRLDVSYNDRLLGTVQFAGRTAAEFTLPISVDLLKDGANTVTLVATGGALDYSLVDTIQVRYPHAYAATDGRLELSLGAGEQARVTGLESTDLVLVDTTALDQLALVTPRFEKDGSGATLVVGADTARTFLAVTPARFRSPVSVVPNAPSSWASRFTEADGVILTSASMLGPAQSLQQYRRQAGLRVVIADIEDVYDEFSYGQKSPYAVRELVARSRSWRLPPSYLLLLGDATLDPKNYLGFGDFDFVPTKLVPTAFMKAASDDWLVDLKGDGMPALAVGRLPARSESEASLLVAKTLAFEQAGAGESWKTSLVLVSDIDQSGFSFTTLSQDLEKLAGPGYQTQHIAVGALGNTGARTALLASLNAGALLVDFAGHGSQQTWRSTLFKNADALTLTNGGRLPIVTSMTCLNGYFQDVYGDSLAEALLRAPNGGAVASWASSTLTDPTAQADLVRAFFSLAFGPTAPRLGEAARAAKAATSDPDVRRSWILLGDPMLRVK